MKTALTSCRCILAASLLAFNTTAFAKDKKHLPLPSQVTDAKTVYIDNQSGIAAMGDKAYQQLEKWGRFQVVQDRKKAHRKANTNHRLKRSSW